MRVCGRARREHRASSGLGASARRASSHQLHPDQPGRAVLSTPSHVRFGVLTLRSTCTRPFVERPPTVRTRLATA